MVASLQFECKSAYKSEKGGRNEEMREFVRAAQREAKKHRGNNKPDEHTGDPIFDCFLDLPSQATGDSGNPLYIIDTQRVQV
jgi:hypothetical protein